MIETLSPRILGLIIDMDGVLWRDQLALVDLGAFFDEARQRGLKFILATNNATRSPQQILSKLRGFGAELEEGDIVTSSMAVAYLLRQQYPNGGRVFIVGEVGLVNALQKSGFEHAEENVLAVVAGLDRALTYEKVRRACLLIRVGAAFYGTNPDATYPAPEGQVPGAGMVLAAIQVASGKKPVIAGKPQPGMFRFALEQLGTAPEETLVIGDRLDTDIAGGQAAGCRTALILTGVTTRADAQAWSPQPDLVLNRVDEIFSCQTKND